ncbi:hypothetical protein AGR2A_pa40163 [Agrobacterium genomosp. 2 str. CFBP 5494]|uniref:Uncharacterized protein n=1 Tax=Agrobacterium genomosp. 2 str. CFBP 5494 TaxID=1183436 RepID=A0A9W5B7D6_9HYPH|nr:hypothetical protein AGR2A_pa40163 [Agrobacterium genomosp. 2 str. CFBP 5494]
MHWEDNFESVASHILIGSHIASTFGVGHCYTTQLPTATTEQTSGKQPFESRYSLLCVRWCSEHVVIEYLDPLASFHRLIPDETETINLGAAQTSS